MLAVQVRKEADEPASVPRMLSIKKGRNLFTFRTVSTSRLLDNDGMWPSPREQVIETDFLQIHVHLVPAGRVEIVRTATIVHTTRWPVVYTGSAARTRRRV